ncbi:hypothetical protein B0O79_2365 [Flavobacteriaceae bacterium MAR_2009_75]|nr:hypothetical protein B0O79_2365 [Flavobacteriaceae bacterium MAR_2009_75]
MLFSTLSYSQIEKDNGQVVWRMIKSYENNSETFFKTIKSSGKFSELALSGEEIIGKFEDVPIVYKGTASMYLMSSNLMGSFKIQFKNGRYRITAGNIKFKSQTSVGVFDQGSVESIEKYALDRSGDYKKRFKAKDIPIIEDSLSRLFHFKEDDDW